MRVTGLLRQVVLAVPLLAIVGALLGCNAIIGADAPTEREEDSSVAPMCEGPGCTAADDAGLDARPTDASLDQSTADAARADVLVEAAPDALEGEESSVSEAGPDAPPDALPDAPSDTGAESGCGDTTTDPHNCGACGHDCTALPHVMGAATCGAAGQCVFPLTACAAGWTHCSGNADQGCETDISKVANCGGCGNACLPAMPVCSGSAGTYACTTGCSGATPTLCTSTSTCVDTATDPGNCATCGNACPGVTHGQPTCVGSQCSVSCNTSYTNCSGACVDVTSDDSNCAACGKACTGGAHCSGSTCQCTGGTHLCGSSCVANDNSACGPSCVACPGQAPTGGSSTCNGTTCVPSCAVSTDAVCSNVCVDETVNGNCGACGTTCTGTTPDCVGGSCVQCTTGTQCAPTGNTPQTCVANKWVNQTACASPTPVCANGGCVECTSGTQCDSTNTWIQGCVNDVWTDQMMCPSNEICRSAACVSALEDLGNASALPGSFSLFANILYTLRLPPMAHNAVLLTFGTFGNAGGANAKLVLYGDNGAGTAPSGAAIAAVTASLALIDGQREQSASTNPTLTEGTVYWLGIVVDTSTTMAAQTDAASITSKVSLPFGSVPPWPAGSGGATVGSDLAIYISVQDLN
jgi:hypothetical protein